MAPPRADSAALAAALALCRTGKSPTEASLELGGVPSPRTIYRARLAERPSPAPVSPRPPLVAAPPAPGRASPSTPAQDAAGREAFEAERAAPVLELCRIGWTVKEAVDQRHEWLVEDIAFACEAASAGRSPADTLAEMNARAGAAPDPVPRLPPGLACDLWDLLLHATRVGGRREGLNPAEVDLRPTRTSRGEPPWLADADLVERTFREGLPAVLAARGCRPAAR